MLMQCVMCGMLIKVAMQQLTLWCGMLTLEYGMLTLERRPNPGPAECAHRLNKTTKRCENAHFGVRTTPRFWDTYQIRQNTAIVNIDVDALIPGGNRPVRCSVGIQHNAYMRGPCMRRAGMG